MINQEFRRKSAINHQLEKGHLNFHCRNVKSGSDYEEMYQRWVFSIKWVCWRCTSILKNGVLLRNKMQTEKQRANHTSKNN